MRGKLAAIGRARRNNRFCFPHASPEMQTAEMLAVAAMKVFKIQSIEWWARQGSNLYDVYVVLSR